MTSIKEKLIWWANEVYVVSDLDAQILKQDLLAGADRIEELEEDTKFIEALRAAGVDNWEGYSDAQELME